MLHDEKLLVVQVIEKFIRTGDSSHDKAQVVRLPDNKTSFLERNGSESNTILLDEFKVDDKSIWAGYSRRSNTVYISLVVEHWAASE